MKGFRIAFLTLVFAAALAALQISFRPIHAAQQSAAAGAETSPPAKAGASQESGADEYAKHCAVCHGAGREGNLPGFPPLVGISHRMTNDQIAQLIHAGKGRMPGFPSVQGSELAEILHYLDSTPAPAESGNASEPSAPVAAGDALFHQNCAFCHGRDAMGGETGPDLTQSKIVLSDKTGEKIAAVVREGRPDNKMPPFNFSSQEMTGLVAFIRARVSAAEAHKGARKGVSVEDLQTGNAEAGKAYFNGAGGCSKCHSPSGDLAGIASRTQGLQLEEQMLSPRGAKSRVTLTDPSGETVSGTLAYRDEFTIALRDASGVYRSWQASSVKFTVDSPVDAHAEQFEKYTDDDIHNLMAYLQTLK
ncbi:MAG TPA: c-type cytochrome [Terracidiphilus sp.]|nr:c-type cytochrome [Terracidiphilus sp.]